VAHSYLAPLAAAGREPLSAADATAFEAVRAQVAGSIDWMASFQASEPLLALTVYNAFDDLQECVPSLLATTPPGVPIVAIDDGSPDERVSLLLSATAAARPNFHWFRKLWNTGVVDSCELAFHLAGRRDVVILNSDIVVPPGWLDRLRRAAYSRSTVASTTPLSNNALIYSVPHRNQPWRLEGTTVEEVDERVRAASLERFPPVPSAITFCTYIRRSALDLVGTYDLQFSPGYGEEVDWSQRALMHGLENVLADNVFIHHKGGASFGTSPAKQAMQNAHEAVINRLYPWHNANAIRSGDDPESPLAQSLAVASAAILGLRVAVDATSMANYITGTETALAHFVARLEEVKPDRARLTVIVPDNLDLTRLDVLDGGLWSGIEVITRAESVAIDAPFFDVVHRPCQVVHPEQVDWLQGVARRVIVSQLDCIAYSNPLYHDDATGWRRYQEAAEAAFETADGIFYNSHEVRRQCETAGLHLPEGRGLELYNGVDHLAGDAATPTSRLAAQLSDQPFLLVLGADWMHKNRLFALRVQHQLSLGLGWPGRLVLAGSQAGHGGTASAERSFLAANPQVARTVVDLGPVPEADKAWLLANAGLVLYPSTVEGFGFIPFEAAAHGTPALTSAGSVFPEVLGPAVAKFTEFEPEGVAALAHRLLTDPDAAATQVAAIKERAATFTWAKVAQAAWAFYLEIHRLPKRVRSGTALHSERLTADHRHRLEELELIKGSRSYRLARRIAKAGAPMRPIRPPRS